MKILTTAMFSVAMLGKKLESLQWCSLLTLIAGVSLVQISGLKETQKAVAQTNSLIGLLCVLLACCSSGFAGVYFEKVLKGSEVSVWIRNVQLAFIGIVVGLAGVYYTDREMVTEVGFFDGYNSVVWGVICLQAFGGIIVAVVVKYADNLLKGFATSVSIVLSCILSIFLFNDFGLSTKFIMGTLLVIAATTLYGTPSSFVEELSAQFFKPVDVSVDKTYV